MSELILHHYPMSPYAELVRRALGIKGLAWHSVMIPNVAPKPDLTPLTGGYRKTPVLQIGADIYCDTAIIIEAIEALHPAQTLFPAPLGRAAALMALQAGGTTFSQAVGSAMAPFMDRLGTDFIEDRRKLFGMDPDRMAKVAPHLLAQFRGWLARIDDTLADGRAFLGGDAPGYADCSVAMNIWFQGNFGQLEARLTPFPNIAAWYGRLDALGRGMPTDMTGKAALDIAQAATPTMKPDIAADCALALDQPVTVRTEDPGADIVAGRLLRCTDRAISIVREDPRVGTVAVHFPRIGQILSPAA
ncbi:MAG: glutathione S-transferase family protein [Sphingomonas sp.]